jgi:hypothetical protein
LQNRNELITHCPVIVREAQLESQDLVVIHGEVRDAIVQNAIVDRIHSPLISVLWDQKEIHPGKGREEKRSEKHRTSIFKFSGQCKLQKINSQLVQIR